MSGGNHDSQLMRMKTRGTPRCLEGAAKHNLRDIAGPHIDGARSCCNVVLRGPATAKAVAGLANERMLAAGKNPAAMRKNGARMAEIIFSLSSSSAVDHAGYFSAALAWVERQFGEDAVLSAVVHHDEAHPHLHVLMLPMKHGEWLASRVFGQRADVMRLQDDFFINVAGRFGVRRAPKKLGANDTRAAAQRVIEELKRIEAPELHGPLWPKTVADIRRDPGPYAELLGVEVKRSLKTMAEIFTSKGRGAARENCYSASTTSESNVLPCVSTFAAEPPSGVVGIAASQDVEEMA